MTKWKGQVASYAPQVGHLQSVSVAAMAAALAFGGAMAVPSEAQAQDVTVVVDSGAPAPVAEVNNGDGALIIRATVPVTGVEATNAASAKDLDIETDDITSPSNGVLATNNGSGLTSVNTTAGVVSATGGSGISVKTLGNGLDINAGRHSRSAAQLQDALETRLHQGAGQGRSVPFERPRDAEWRAGLCDSGEQIGYDRRLA